MLPPTDSWVFLVLYLGVTLIALWTCWRYSGEKLRRKTFPCPLPDPIIGHLRIFPRQYPWLKLTEWSKQYGNIIQLSAAGTSILVLNTAEQAYNFMEKKGNIYSGRPQSALQGEIAGFDRIISFIHYGDEFKIQRRHISQYYNSRTSKSLHPLLVNQIKILLKNVLDEPEKFEDHFDRLSSGIIVKSTYGYDILSNDDEYIKLAVRTIGNLTSLGVPGLTIVDMIPLLRHMPDWVPGGWLLRKARHVRVLMDEMMTKPYERVKADKKTGQYEQSFVSSLLEQYEQSEEHIDEKIEMRTMSTAAQIYMAGTETISIVFASFVYLMLSHRDTARKAQQQIDEVTSGLRLPTLEDRSSIPYIDCIAKEVLRFNPPAPLGVPHAALTDDIHEGIFIPAGTIVIPNVWAMMHDELYFEEPHIFNPDRFLSKISIAEEDEGPSHMYKPDDPITLNFGFGRRICPGRFFADTSEWLVIASVLAVFDILPPIDPDTGIEYIPKFVWIDGLSSKPKPFPCRLVPRSEEHVQLILQACS